MLQSEKASREENGEKRIVFLDILRILAAFSIVLLHVSGPYWSSGDVGSLDWKLFTIYNGSVRWAVPAFVMISGSLMLGRNLSLKQIYHKYLPRILIAYFFWSFAYCMLDTVKYHYDLITIAEVFISGPFHLWFLPMMAGLYLVIPFLDRIISSRSLSKYFLGMSLFFAVLLPWVVTFAGKLPGNIGGSLQALINNLNLHLVLGFSGYFVLGYYLSKENLSKVTCRLVYILGILGWAATITLTIIFSLRREQPTEMFFGPLNPNVLLMAAGIFLYFKNHMQYKSTLSRFSLFARKLSICSMGIYLLHPMVKQLCLKLFPLTGSNPGIILYIPLIACLIFAVTACITALLAKVPVIKKLIL